MISLGIGGKKLSNDTAIAAPARPNWSISLTVQPARPSVGAFDAPAASMASSVTKVSVSTRASPQLAVAGIAACLMVVVSAVAGHRTESEAPPVSYTHLRAHETVLDLVCRL